MALPITAIIWPPQQDTEKTSAVTEAKMRREKHVDAESMFFAWSCRSCGLSEVHHAGRVCANRQTAAGHVHRLQCIGA